jgi:hypothetical protein
MRREAVVGLRRGPTISTVWADGRPIPTITKKKLAYLLALVFGCNIANF